MSTAPLHSKLPPSGASRWSVCTASIPYIEENDAILPKDGGVEADEGTRAHAAASELLLNAGSSPVFDNDEMAGYVGDYVDFVKAHIDEGDEVMIEKRVSLFYLPSQRGTVDVGIISKDRKRITIIDLKYGAGVGVYARENKQLAIYAESLIAEMESIDDIPGDALVTLIIHQPRDRNDPEANRLWAISRADLAAFVVPITEAALRIQKGEPGVFVADPEGHCRFCRAKGICKTYAAYGLSVVPEEQIVAPPDPKSLTREQRIRIIKARSGLEKWLEAVEDQEMAELLSGAPRMGLKLVEGKSNRAWSDEEAAEKLLGNYLSIEERRKPAEVISIAQAEKALKKVEKAGTEISTKFWTKFAALQSKPPGKPSLVDESDKRPALSLNPAEGMSDLTGSDCI